MKSIIVISKSQKSFRQIHDCLTEYEVSHVLTCESALTLLEKKRHDIIFTELQSCMTTAGPADPGNGYRTVFQTFWQICPSVEIIVITPQEMIREGVMAVKAGAGNYITAPINPDEVRYVTESLYEEQKKQSELDYLRDQFWEKDVGNMAHTCSAVMKQAFEKIRSAAPTLTTIMLYGDTGVGKGVMAGLIHRHSKRTDKPFISVHCGAIPDTLIESELFGHEKGAFTGAVRRKLGKFEIAQGGTIFLDEIGTITPAAQIKLLQVLQDRTFQRVGGEEVIRADVRVIAASNVNLKTMCDAGTFRRDLYYRLNVFPVDIPNLRDRKEDIPLLADYFVRQLNLMYGKEIQDVHPAVRTAFQHYDWPGNIREMENLIERAYILEKSIILTPESFPAEIFVTDIPAAPVRFNSTRTLMEVRRTTIETVEHQYLLDVLARNRGKINESARDAGISTRQLHKLLTRYGIRKENFK